MTSNSVRTKKGNRTRAARKQFANTYSEVTVGIISMLVSGYSTAQVAQTYGVPRSTVATYKANLTRGIYSPFVRSNGSGTCNFRS